MHPNKPLRDHTYEELDALQRACFDDRHETERTLDAIAREAARRFKKDGTAFDPHNIAGAIR